RPLHPAGEGDTAPEEGWGNVPRSISLGRSGQQAAACDAEDLAVDVTCFVAGEEDEGGGELGRLRWTTHGRVLAEVGVLLCIERLNDQRRPDRSRCHAVHSDTALDERLGQTLGEGHERAL